MSPLLVLSGCGSCLLYVPSTFLILDAFIYIWFQQRAIFGAPPKLRLLVRGYFHRQRLLALIQSLFSEAALGASSTI